MMNTRHQLRRWWGCGLAAILIWSAVFLVSDSLLEGWPWKWVRESLNACRVLHDTLTSDLASAGLRPSDVITDHVTAPDLVQRFGDTMGEGLLPYIESFDRFGSPLNVCPVTKLVSEQLVPQTEATWFAVYSSGRNGINESGGGDDIVYVAPQTDGSTHWSDRWEARAGHYDKKYLVVAWSFLPAIAAAIILMAASWCVHRDATLCWLGTSVVLMCLGLIVLFVYGMSWGTQIRGQAWSRSLFATLVTLSVFTLFGFVTHVRARGRLGQV